jgi:dethiobiotin synthetase
MTWRVPAQKGTHVNGLEGTIVVTGTGTDVGKTIATAALAAVAMDQGRRVSVVKPAQTGVDERGRGDADEVGRLVPGVARREFVRFPDPLAPNTAARRAGRPPLRIPDAVAGVRKEAAGHDLVLVEGAGGLLAWFDDEGHTLADLATELRAPVVLVAAPGLGTLNATALTAEALRRRGLDCLGIVVGSWPSAPDLAMRCNLVDLERVSGYPVVGAIPEGMGRLSSKDFRAAARASLSPAVGGELAVDVFRKTYAEQ